MGTGQEVGVGGVRVGDDTPNRQAAVAYPVQNLQLSEATVPPATPLGCRYLRVHRPAGRYGEVMYMPSKLLLRYRLGIYASALRMVHRWCIAHGTQVASPYFIGLAGFLDNQIFSMPF